MIFDGASAADRICAIGTWIWCLIIALLIIVWLIIGIKNLGSVNVIAMAALSILSIILSIVILRNVDNSSISGSISFGAAVELSAAMPISWLPLISDYTRDAEKPVKATAASALTYGAISCWMYAIGMGAAIFTAETDIAGIMAKAGLGAAGLLIIVFSTVTTTFLDAYSAGISCESISEKADGKSLAIAAAAIGCAGAITLPLQDITGFLYLIGSVFAPMIAIQIADFFILRKDRSTCSAYLPNILIWLIGFVLYRVLMGADTIIGSTLPDMLITILLSVIVSKIFPEKQKPR